MLISKSQRCVSFLFNAAIVAVTAVLIWAGTGGLLLLVHELAQRGQP